MKLILKSQLFNYDRYTLPKPKAIYWSIIRCRNKLYTHHSINSQNLWQGLDFYETIKPT